jgi:hypothetical protein
MNLNSITGLAGVTVIAGVTPFAAGGSANDGTVVTGTLTSNNMRMGSVDGPAFDVFASISGLGAGSENTRQVSGALTYGQVIQGTGTTPSVGRLNSVEIHSQFNNRSYVFNDKTDTIITQDGRLFLTTTQAYYEPGVNVLTAINYVAGSGDPNTNKEYYQFGGIRPTGSST